MLTTEREIKNKQERYGSFEVRSNIMASELGLDKDNKQKIVGAKAFNNIRSVDSSVETHIDAPKSTPINETKSNAVILPGNKRLNVSDAYSNVVRENKKISAGVTPREKLRTKNIVMIVAYCLVVVALITIIALNASAITGLSEKNAALSNEVAELTNTYAALSTELSALSDISRIETLAETALNLTETEATIVTMNVPIMREIAKDTYQANWFDKLCDSVSSLIGG